jgi:hypothetical protein
MAAAGRHSGLSVRDGKIADARAAGATDLEIRDTVLTAAAFCMMNRYVDGPAAITAGAQRLSRTVMSRRQLRDNATGIG